MKKPGLRTDLLWKPVRVLMVLLSLVTAGCSTTRTISLDILVPAEKALPAGNGRFTLVNRSLQTDSLSLAAEKELTEEQDREFIKVANSLTRECLVGMVHMLENSPVADTVVIRDYGTLDSLNISHSMEWGILDSLSGEDPEEWIVSLEYFTVTFDQNNGFFSGDLFDEYSDLYYLELDLGLHSFWRVYDPMDLSQRDSFWMRDTTFLYAEGNSPEEAVSALPDLASVLMESAYWTGYETGKMLVPSWIQVDRFYFRGGSRNLKKGEELAGQNKWMEAAAAWRKDVKSKNKLTAARAMYNLALVAEIQDELDIALSWAVQSYYKYNHPAAKRYIEVLSQRISERDRLKKQL